MSENSIMLLSSIAEDDSKNKFLISNNSSLFKALKSAHIIGSSSGPQSC